MDLYYKALNQFPFDDFIYKNEGYGSYIPLVMGNGYYDEFLRYLSDNNLTIDDIPDYPPPEE